MRRMIVILGVVLLMFTGLAYGGYPEDYHGDLLPDGCWDVQSTIIDWHDRNPWGQTDPTGVFFLFGSLCTEDGVAVLDLTEWGWRRCYEAPWGTPGNPPICNATYLGEWKWSRHVLAYDTGVYISGIWTEDREGQGVYLFVALTYDADTNTARFVEGAFSLSSIWFSDNDNYTRTTWSVEPWTAEYTNLARVFLPKRLVP